MSARRVAWLLPIALVACGGDGADTRPAPHGLGGNAGSGAGGSGGGGAESGGSAGQSGASGAGGGAPSGCGNGAVEAVEQCDGSDLQGNDCQSLGHDGGTLGCTPGCVFDESACFGAERCNDGLDNDQDGKPDCADSDCSVPCSDPCSAPQALADPGYASGTTVGHSSKLDASCSGKPSGAEVVYAFTPKTTGVAEAVLTSNQPLTLSLGTTCGSPSAELGCVAQHVKVKVTAGQPLFVVIEGHDATVAGAFSLSLASHAISCGDASRDDPEQCDDGNTQAGDGCDASCQLEPAETEPNDSSATATPLVQPFFGQVAPPGDVDWVKISVSAAQAPASLTADTFDLGDGACAKLELDSELRLFASDGATLLASDDDGGSGACAHLTASGLGAGSYALRVSASGQGETPVFPYRLAIDLDLCGNGKIGGAESCDDGNAKGGDGCSATCAKE